MLVDPSFYQPTEADYARGVELNFSRDYVYSLMSVDIEEHVKTGVFVTYDLNARNRLTGNTIDFPAMNHQQEYYDLNKEFTFSDLPHDYGVADTIEQVLEHYQPYIDDETKKYSIFITPILKSDQPEEGGWRWHKWGKYVGLHTITCEYLYDEPNIDRVLSFRVVEIRD